MSPRPDAAANPSSPRSKKIGSKVSAIPEATDDEVAIDPAVAESPLGIRLADDVRLPAAAMPVDFKMSPVAEKMLKEIVNDYYRELAAAAEPEAHASDGEETERTLVISNGPLAEAARKRADYRFRALFGNAAYNRMTMNSVLEAQLPVAQAPE